MAYIISTKGVVGEWGHVAREYENETGFESVILLTWVEELRELIIN